MTDIIQDGPAIRAALAKLQGKRAEAEKEVDIRQRADDLLAALRALTNYESGSFDRARALLAEIDGTAAQAGADYRGITALTWNRGYDSDAPTSIYSGAGRGADQVRLFDPPMARVRFRYEGGSYQPQTAFWSARK